MITVWTALGSGVDRDQLSSGAGATPPALMDVSAVSSGRVRVSFTQNMADDADLYAPENYSIAALISGDGLVVQRCERVSAFEVDLITNQHTAKSYNLRAFGMRSETGVEVVEGSGNYFAFMGDDPGYPADTPELYSFLGTYGGLETFAETDFLPDVTPPYLANQDPAPGETSVSPSTTIAFDLQDSETPVNPDSVIVYIAGVLAWQYDSPRPGFSGSRTPLPPYGQSYAITPDDDLAEGSPITVSVYAEDEAAIPNALDETYTFYTLATAPTVLNRDPAPFDDDVAPTDHILFDVIDPESGINPASVKLWFNDALIYTNEIPVAGWSVTRTTITNGYHFDVDKTGGSGKMPGGETAFRLYARNSAPSPAALDTTWYFTVFVDTVAPWIENAYPEPNSDTGETERPIYFTVADDHGVDFDTVTIRIDGEPIFEAGAFKPGWLDSLVGANPGAHGYNFLVIPDEGAWWEEGQTVTVNVRAEDTAGLVMDAVWSFTLGGEPFPFGLYNMIIRSIREKDEGA